MQFLLKRILAKVPAQLLVFGLVFVIVFGARFLGGPGRFFAWLFGHMLPLLGILAAGAVGFIVWRIRLEGISRAASQGDPVAMDLERRRDSALWTALAAVLLGGMSLFVLRLFGAPIQWAFPIALLVFVLMLGWAWSIVLDYGQLFKWNFVAHEFARVFDDLEYDPLGHVSSWDVWLLNLFEPPPHEITSGGRVTGNDLIRASYKGLRFEQSDIQLHHTWIEMTQDRRGREVEVERSRLIFSGRAMSFNFAEPFRADVRVADRNFQGLGPTLSLWREVRTELARFDDRFEVMTSDPLDALTILTPQMVEAIYRLRQAVGVPLVLLFRDSSMYAFLALKRDPFEASLWRTLSESRAQLRRDIKMTTDFLDTMYFRRQEGQAPLRGDDQR